MPKKLDIVGKRFGSLMVIEEHDERKNEKVCWLCECECGGTTIVPGSALKSGNTKSCGCMHKSQLVRRNTKHGLCGSKIYQTWKGMKARCYNENEEGYKWYGGRGIYVADEWRNNPKAFYHWSVENGWMPSKCIDRIDNDGPYSPSNCRWINNEENCQNRSDTQLTPLLAWLIRGMHIPGVVTYKMISEAFGVSYGVVSNVVLNRSWKNV